MDDDRQKPNPKLSETAGTSHGTDALRILALIIAEVHTEHALMSKRNSGEVTEKE